MSFLFPTCFLSFLFSFSRTEWAACCGPTPHSARRLPPVRFVPTSVVSSLALHSSRKSGRISLRRPVKYDFTQSFEMTPATKRCLLTHMRAPQPLLERKYVVGPRSALARLRALHIIFRCKPRTRRRGYHLRLASLGCFPIFAR
ncbi:hypothetical protein B0H17DRAFT_711827 [Mycena rosella]|uniref:Secreted protein n=1 Tax=Mycena rosella TaxID=1033263 RepID=A0AAD7DA82_MYCRO|nr:hypothetical protein B0H17DRAFT_711827 [Mycena rosella]